MAETNTYYIRIHFDGTYVTGFLVPNAIDEKHAVKMLKLTIWARMQRAKELESQPGYYRGMDNFSVARCKSYLRSLKHPWRWLDNPRHKGEIRNTGFRDKSSPMVKVEPLILPTYAGYWLKNIFQS